MTATLPQPQTDLSDLPLLSERARVDNRPILVATDATSESDAALRVAQSMALHTFRSVQVVAVYEPMPIAAPEVTVVESPDMEAQRRQALRERVGQQFARTGLIYDWPVDVVCGDPAYAVARIARECDAAVVVMGLGKHGLVQRLLGDETALRMLRLGSVPVLAVAPTASQLPLRVLAGMDFSPSSVRALALAATVIHSFARIEVVHVAPPREFGRIPSANSPSSLELDAAFDRMEREVKLPKTMRATRKMLRGDPARVLLKECAGHAPDLIVVGSHGRGFLSRLVIGSVSQKLVRDASCSILVAPPEDGPTYLEEMQGTVSRAAQYQWIEQLEEFSRRNAGRRATLEVMGLDLGAQLEERGLPFRGASFDARDRRVQIMLGDDRANGRHLTRSIAGVTAVQLLRDRAGRDVLLRIGHGDGQTLLTLER
jgi:nucleotide-binding universal stress UspA family protein